MNLDSFRLQVLAIILDVYGSIRRETGKSETAYLGSWLVTVPQSAEPESQVADPVADADSALSTKSMGKKHSTAGGGLRVG